MKKLIDALRYCADGDNDCGDACPFYDKQPSCSMHDMMNDAADAIEAADEMIADCVAAIDALDDSNDAYIKENERLKKRIAELEAQMPKEGEWIPINWTYDSVLKCSNCGELACCFGDYCPNCGAKMDGETEHGNTYSLGKIEMPNGAMKQIIADGERKEQTE